MGQTKQSSTAMPSTRSGLIVAAACVVGLFLFAMTMEEEWLTSHNDHPPVEAAAASPALPLPPRQADRDSWHVQEVAISVIQEIVRDSPTNQSAFAHDGLAAVLKSVTGRGTCHHRHDVSIRKCKPTTKWSTYTVGDAVDEVGVSRKWTKHTGLNCYPKHGAISMLPGPFSAGMSLAECQDACVSNCTAVVFEEASQQELDEVASLVAAVAAKKAEHANAGTLVLLHPISLW